MQKFNSTLFLSVSMILSTQLFAAENNSQLSYSNSDFNQAQPGWANTLTINNDSDKPIVITQLQFETNYSTLDTNQLYGTIDHTQVGDAKKINEFDYQYTLKTASRENKDKFTTIQPHDFVYLNQIPIAHEQTSQNGIPLYYRLPFNIKVTLQDGIVIAVPIENKCENTTCNNPANNKIIAAYFTDWANYHYPQNSKNVLMPNQIPIKHMNTLFYAIGKINPQNADISFVDINHDQYYLPSFDTLKQQYPYLNLIYSFGGWGDTASNSFPSYDLAAIFDQHNPALIQTLANNMVKTMQNLGFNGIDIDYEWNAVEPNNPQGMTLTPARALGYQQLLQAIRIALNKIEPNSNEHYYKLTTAFFAGSDKVTEFVTNGGNWAEVASAVDYIGVMTYDMHGQFDQFTTPPDNITDFQSQMQTEHAYQSESKDILNHYNVVDGIAAYKNQNVPANKLIVGIPAYARIEKTALPVTDINKGLYLPLSADQPLGETKSGGVTEYKCIVNNDFCWGGFNFNRSTLHYVNPVFSDNTLGSLAKTPWAYDMSQQWFMSFDDASSTDYKANWVKENNLAGVMIWEIDGDIPSTDATYQQNSLMYHAWKTLT